MRGILMGVLALGLFLQGAAEAQTSSEPMNEVARGYVYYHRAGATLASHDAAFRDCAVRMVAVQDGRLYRPIPPGNVPGLVTLDLYYGGLARAAAASRIENCMVVRGWTVYRLADEDGAAIARLEGTALDQALERLIVSEQPSGVPIRQWANQIRSPRLNRLVAEPRSPSDRHLGFRALARVTATNPIPDLDPAPGSRSIYEEAEWLAERFEQIQPNLDVRNLPVPEPGRAILLIRVKNGSMTYGGAMQFLRETPFPAGGFHYQTVTPMVGTTFQRREGKWFAASVPAGQWVFASLGVMTFCMGAPTFEIQSGAVVYAGTFDVSGDASGPDLDLAPALAAIGGAGKDLLQAAEYRNGGTYSCDVGLNRYAMEIPGAPFVEGYEWGSRAMAD